VWQERLSSSQFTLLVRDPRSIDVLILILSLRQPLPLVEQVAILAFMPDV